MSDSDEDQNQNMGAALAALDKLVRSDIDTPEDLEEYSRELSGLKSDRSVVILLAANLENALDMAITRRMQLKPKRQRELFANSGPLGGFRSKVVFAHALNIFGGETRRNLEIIRSLRNAFAHAKISLSFTSPAVKEALKFLTVPKVVSPYISPLPVLPDPLEGSELYKTVCDRTSHNLVWRWLNGGILQINKGALNVHIPMNDYEIVAIKLPLP